MKKLLFLTVPLLLMGAVALSSKGADANYADFDRTGATFNPKQWETIGDLKNSKENLFLARGSLLDEDPTLQKDVNEQDIQREKANFSNKIGKGLDVADASPLAYKNNEKHTQDIFDTTFLNNLYVYGDFDPQQDTKSDYKMESNAVSLTTKMGSSIAVSVGVEATYACITAEASTKVGFSIEFSNTMSNSSAVYYYNYFRKTYYYGLPLFTDHSSLYKNHLTTTFKNDLNLVLQKNNQSDYEAFFKKYGSHVVMSGFYGGASTVYGSIVSNAMKNSVETKESVAVKVGGGLDCGAYKIKGTVGTETTFSQGFGIDVSQSRETYQAEYYGGDEAPASHSLGEIFDTANSWTSTIDEHPVCVKYDTVIPVWWLLTGAQDTESNAHALENAFYVYRADRNNFYTSLAYEVEFNSNLKYSWKVTPDGQENIIAAYWDDKYKTYFKKVSLYDEDFYNLTSLENNGFDRLQIRVRFKAKATKRDAKVKLKVFLGGVDFGYDYEYSVNKSNDFINVNYDRTYSSNLSEIMYADSNFSLEFKTNSGAGWFCGNEKEVILKDIVVDMVYLKPERRGTGVSNDPYLISSLKDLRNIENHLTAYYKLTQNIYFNSSSWTPIRGTFTGTLDGNGYEFKGLKISTGYYNSGAHNVGLFETLGSGSWISNLTFRYANINISSTSYNPIVYAGILAGMQQASSMIYNCNFVDCSISLNTQFGLVGSVAGYARGTLNCCYINGVTVYGKDVVGGVVGSLDTNGIAQYCIVDKSTNARSKITLNAGTNTAGSYRAGGIAGYAFSSKVANSKVQNTDFVLSGSATRNPAMGYIVGHLNYGNIVSSTQSGNNRNPSSSSSTNFFAQYSGKVGKKEGTCTVS